MRKMIAVLLLAVALSACGQDIVARQKKDAMLEQLKACKTLHDEKLRADCITSVRFGESR